MVYTPKPMDTSDVSLSEDLMQAMEIIAKNTHEVWAEGRMKLGWTYGNVYDGEQKKHPCLVPYETLKEREKAFDRQTSLQVMKCLLKMGFEIVPKKP